MSYSDAFFFLLSSPLLSIPPLSSGFGLRLKAVDHVRREQRREHRWSSPSPVTCMAARLYHQAAPTTPSSSTVPSSYVSMSYNQYHVLPSLPSRKVLRRPQDQLLDNGVWCFLLYHGVEWGNKRLVIEINSMKCLLYPPPAIAATLAPHKRTGDKDEGVVWIMDMGWIGMSAWIQGGGFCTLGWVRI